ncbi:MAG: hypothetical protein ABI862_00975, partial [Ilumatobacteraceae bacterium]
MTIRRSTAQYGLLVAVAALATGIVVAAVLADGRVDVRAATNDGGAWLIRRSNGTVGQVNRATGEATGTIGVATPGTDFDLEQDGPSIVVNDVSAQTLSVIDGRTFQVVNRIHSMASSHLALAADGGVVWTESPLQLWRLNAADLTQLVALDPEDSLVALNGAGLAVTATDGTIWVVDLSGHRVGVVEPADSGARWFDIGDAASTATAVTTVGTSLVIAGPGVGGPGVGGTADGATVVGVDGSTHVINGVPAGSHLAIPAPANSPLAAVTPDGVVLSAALGDPTAAEVGKAGGAQPVAPIAYQGCVFAAVAAPPTFTRSCAGVTDQTVTLDGSTGASLRLRLVNGWIWVNDLDSGALWVTSTTGAVDRIDDWGSDLSPDNNGDQESNQQGN